MPKVDLSAMPCSIARSLDVIGEGWTILVLRDVFRGIRRFDELQRNLGIATNVLTARLKRLVDEGLLERRPYEQRPPRYEYHLTAKGRDLYPVLIALVNWGDKYLAGAGGPPRVMVHKVCGKPTSPMLVCSECGEPVESGDLRLLSPEEDAQRTQRAG
jgi:DNA-binding HxlR family transcriptional regulator